MFAGVGDQEATVAPVLDCGSGGCTAECCQTGYCCKLRVYLPHVFPRCNGKVHGNLKDVTDSLHAHVVADIYDFLFASYQDVYDERLTAVLDKWRNNESLAGPQAYFYCVDDERQFIRLTKRDCMLRSKQKIIMLIGQLADCCGYQLVTHCTFKDVPDATQQVKERVKEFRQKKLLTS
ncbi:hypothetical protein PHMEG_0006211 [Phytophthora megakarya]|uniref:Uncharacterized protein n=1 Tax=Phytophthora megakarya TaxID=4795 RepID=A0A225WR32_9STRA|nr:hypothetical protein PHMEG_0006211 [Phytophthora megakarya]